MRFACFSFGLGIFVASLSQITLAKEKLTISAVDLVRKTLDAVAEETAVKTVSVRSGLSQAYEYAVIRGVVDGQACVRLEKRNFVSEELAGEGELDELYLKNGDGAFEWGTALAGEAWRARGRGIPAESRAITLENLLRDLESSRGPRRKYEVGEAVDAVHGEVYYLSVYSEPHSQERLRARTEKLYESLRARLDTAGADENAYRKLEARDMMEAVKETVTAVEVYKIAKKDLFLVGAEYYNAFGELTHRKRVVHYELGVELKPGMFERPKQ